MKKIIVQLLSVFSGVLAVFFIPAIFGMQEYGEFIKIAILSFLFHRLIDVLNEPLISLSNEKDIFSYSMLNAVFVISFVSIIVLIFNIKGYDLVLLISLSLSSAYINFLYRTDDDINLIKYFVVYIFCFVFMVCLKFFNFIDFSISLFLQITSLLAVFIGMISIKRPVSYILINVESIIKCIKSFKLSLGFVLSNAFFSYLFLYLVMDSLPEDQVGLLRVLFSVVQSVVLLYPINMRHIQKDLIDSGSVLFNKHLKYSSLLFVSISIVAISINEYFFILDMFNVPEAFFVFGIAIMPVVFISYLLERFLVTLSGMKYVSITGYCIYVPLILILHFSPGFFGLDIFLLLFSVISIYSLTLAIICFVVFKQKINLLLLFLLVLCLMLFLQVKGILCFLFLFLFISLVFIKDKVNERNSVI